jgi:hypothetical protein
MDNKETKEMTDVELERLKEGLARTYTERFRFMMDLYKKKMTKNGVLLKPWMIR